MIGKILKATQRKPCLCSSGILCPACKLKESLKPQVFIEEPRRLAVPIIISHYREEPVALGPRWPKRIKKESTKTQVNRNTICRWYQKRKAARQLKAFKKNEDKERLRIAREKARVELEKEYLRHLTLQYQEQERLRALYPPQPEPAVVSKKTEKTKTEVKRKPIGQWYRKRKAERELEALKKKDEKEKIKVAKEKAKLELEKEYLGLFTQQYQEQERLRALYPASEPAAARKHKKKVKIEIKEKKDKKLRVKPAKTNAKPRTVTKYVAVRRESNNCTFTNRCENWCYRLCCQFYCCLTFIVVMGFVIICIV